MNKFNKMDFRQALKLFGMHWFGSLIGFILTGGLEGFLAEVGIFQVYLVIVFVGIQLGIQFIMMVEFGGEMYYRNLIEIRQAKRENREVRESAKPFQVWKGFVIAALVQLPVFIIVILYAVTGESLNLILKIIMSSWFMCFNKITLVWPAPVFILWLICEAFMIAVLGAGYIIGRSVRRRKVAGIYKKRKDTRQKENPRSGIEYAKIAGEQDEEADDAQEQDE